MVNQSPREHGFAADEHPDASVVRLLDAAAAPAEPGPQPGEELALAAFRASHRPRRIRMFSHPTRARAAVAATIGAGTLLFAGVGGAAAAGVLPDHAQNTASTALAALGFDVPRANDRAGDHPTQRGADDDADETTEETEDTTEDATSEDATDSSAETEEAGDPAEPEANQHGKDVSALAHDETLTGADKGATVSEFASGGKSKAGDEHGKPEQPGSQADSHRTTTGDDSADDTEDGTEDADDSADTSEKKVDGPSTADEKSGGRSSQTRP